MSATMKELGSFAELVLLLRKYASPTVKSGVVIGAAQGLVQIGKQLHRQAEKECNEGVDETKSEKVWQDAEETARAFLTGNLGINGTVKVITQGDPRGFVLRLRCRDGETNSWDGETFGIV